MNTEFITYALDNFAMEGFIATGESSQPKQPLVLVIHDWKGSREFDQEKARYFAKQGFTAFAVDLFGKGKRGSDTDNELNIKLYTELMQDRAVIVPRLHAAMECAQANADIDTNKIMLLGFCLGGLCALDFARSGAKVAGVVSVHGNLTPPDHPSKSKILAKVLALHGHEDKGLPPEKVVAFEAEMTKGGADWQLHTFGNTYHAFTNPLANDPAAGLKYSPSADARTWELVRMFTNEIFA